MLEFLACVHGRPAQRNGGTRKAPARLGARGYTQIESAPGRYVRERIVPR